jgi:hypothetical protein
LKMLLAKGGKTRSNNNDNNNKKRNNVFKGYIYNHAEPFNRNGIHAFFPFYISRSTFLYLFSSYCNDSGRCSSRVFFFLTAISVNLLLVKGGII